MPVLLRHLFLVGYRGCGKSTVARLLAERLKVEAIDTDRRIEQLAGATIRDLFKRHGESTFRDLETRAIGELTDTLPAVVALGGGAVLRAENREMLSRLGRAVWLVASPEVLTARITNDLDSPSQRPALTTLPIADEVRQLVERREPLYRDVSEFAEDTEGATPEAIAASILSRLSNSEFHDMLTPRGDV